MQPIQNQSPLYAGVLKSTYPGLMLDEDGLVDEEELEWRSAPLVAARPAPPTKRKLFAVR
jgi:hypothetical protein